MSATKKIFLMGGTSHCQNQSQSSNDTRHQLKQDTMCPNCSPSSLPASRAKSRRGKSKAMAIMESKKATPGAPNSGTWHRIKTGNKIMESVVDIFTVYILPTHFSSKKSFVNNRIIILDFESPNKRVKIVKLMDKNWCWRCIRHRSHFPHGIEVRMYHSLFGEDPFPVINY